MLSIRQDDEKENNNSESAVLNDRASWQAEDLPQQVFS
jgi:hypothetical protein